MTIMVALQAGFVMNFDVRDVRTNTWVIVCVHANKRTNARASPFRTSLLPCTNNLIPLPSVNTPRMRRWVEQTTIQLIKKDAKI